MSAWRAGLSLWMIGSEGFPWEEKLFRDCCNYCFNRTTLSQARRNKPEIILTGWEERDESKAGGGKGWGVKKCGVQEGRAKRLRGQWRENERR